MKLHTWMKEGFKELGDLGGMGIGKTTSTILRHPDFQSDPHMVCFSLITVFTLKTLVNVYVDLLVFTRYAGTS